MIKLILPLYCQMETLLSAQSFQQDNQLRIKNNYKREGDNI